MIKFKQSLVRENERFFRAFTSHLLRFAVFRELDPSDTIAIVEKTREDGFKLQSVIREVVQSKVFVGSREWG